MSGLSTTDKKRIDLSIVAAVNDDEVLERNLLQSPIVKSGRSELKAYREQPSASVAYNKGLMEVDTDYVAFVHQDVYLPDSWEENLLAAIEYLNVNDPDWAVLGVFGLTPESEVVGRVWSSGIGKTIGEPPAKPTKVVTVDELVIILRKGAGCLFDEGLPSFHLYGTDIVQIATSNGHASYVANLPVVHNSRPVLGLSGGYSDSYRYMQRKWKTQLPMKTLIVPITTYGIPLLRKKISLWRGKSERLQRAVSNNTDPREIARSEAF